MIVQARADDKHYGVAVTGAPEKKKTLQNAKHSEETSLYWLRDSRHSQAIVLHCVLSSVLLENNNGTVLFLGENY